MNRIAQVLFPAAVGVSLAAFLAPALRSEKPLPQPTVGYALELDSIRIFDFHPASFLELELNYALSPTANAGIHPVLPVRERLPLVSDPTTLLIERQELADLFPSEAQHESAFSFAPGDQDRLVLVIDPASYQVDAHALPAYSSEIAKLSMAVGTQAAHYPSAVQDRVLAPRSVRASLVRMGTELEALPVEPEVQLEIDKSGRLLAHLGTRAAPVTEGVYLVKAIDHHGRLLLWLQMGPPVEKN